MSGGADLFATALKCLFDDDACTNEDRGSLADDGS